VVVEYFSKWVEAKPLLSITSATIQKFFWQNIVCHLSVPYEVTVDNGKQFDSTDFKELCTYLGTKLCFASVYHPQPNGAVERANGVIFADIKKNITELPKIKWAEELSRVIWSHNTTTSRTTQFSPFKLLYGEEAMLPEELCLGTWRDTPSSNEASRTSRKHAYRPELTCYLTRKKLEDGKTRRFDRSSYGRETWYYARSRREN
jgi:transposase InsO family protein